MRRPLCAFLLLCSLLLSSSPVFGVSSSSTSTATLPEPEAVHQALLQPSDPPIQFEFRFDGGSPEMHRAVEAAGGVWSSHLLSPVPVRVDVKFTALGAVLSAPGFAPPAARITSVYYPVNNQLETFVVGADGAVYVIWKAQNAPWNAPVALTAPGFAPPGAPLSAVYYPLNEQLEVFVVDNSGAVNVLWKAQNGTWNTPVALTAPGVAPIEAPLASTYYPLNEQLEVFFIDVNGAFNVLWKTQNGAWHAPIGLTAAGFAPPSAGLAATYYPPNNQLEVFVVDNNGAVNVMWKAQNGAWNAPAVLTAPGLAPAGAALSSVYYPLNEQLEVFLIDTAGAVEVLWKAQNGAWNAPVGLSSPGLTTPGSQVAATYYSPNEQLEVLFMGTDGAWYVTWKAQNGAWNAPVGLSTPAVAPAGAPVTVNSYPLNNQLEAFVIGVDGDVNLAWKVDNGTWFAPAARLASASGAPLASGDSGRIPAPLQEALRRENLNEDRADITMEINTNVAWYTGLDAAVPADRFDLVSTALHELGHGLGFSASTCRGGDRACDATAMTEASYRQNGRESLPFTSFIEDASGVRIDTYDLSDPNQAANLLTAITGGQLFWGGPGGIAAAGGQRPQLFAGPNWSPGSSVSHLDENTYPSTDLNALMTPQKGFGESHQEPGGITLGIFADLGWQIRTYPPPTPQPSTWSVYQPLNEQLEVLTVDGDGAMTVRWKDNNQAWNAPVGLTDAGLAPANAPVATAFYPVNNQLEAFVVGNDGAIYVIWKAQNEAWNPPVALTPAGIAPPGAQLSAVYYPPNEQLEVFFIDNNGAFNVLWKAQNEAWNAPVGLTEPGFAPPGAAVSGVYYPVNDQLEVLVADTNGAVNVLWKAQNGSWNAPVALTAGGILPPGGALTSVYYPPNEQLEVLFIDNAGAVNVLWKAQNGPWNTPVGLGPAGLGVPGAPIASAYYPLNEQLETFFIDSSGALNVLWKVHNGAWAQPAAITAAGFAAPGSPVAASYYWLGTQLEVFTSDATGGVQLVWKSLNSTWRDPVFIG